KNSSGSIRRRRPRNRLAAFESDGDGLAGFVRVTRLSEGVRGLDPIAIRDARDDGRIRVGGHADARRRNPSIYAGAPRFALNDEMGGATRVVHPVQRELSLQPWLSRSFSTTGEEGSGNQHGAEKLPNGSTGHTAEQYQRIHERERAPTGSVMIRGTSAQIRECSRRSGHWWSCGHLEGG